MSDTPKTDQMEKHAPVGLRRNSAFEQASDLCRQIERELIEANGRIEALNRGNAAAERILCELTGCESGRDVPDWIVAAKNRIKRLEEAGDEMWKWRDVISAQKWEQARREAKP